MEKSKSRLFDLTHAASLLCLAVLIVVFALGEITPLIACVALIFLGLSVMMAVHHAEVIAEKVGPSLGALILALSVTVIEVGLIVSLMATDSSDSAVVARDTVFAAVIIVTNGIVGVCLLLGGLRFKELGFHVGGASSLLMVLAVLSGLTLVLPNFTTTTGLGTYSTSQLLFISAACLVLYFSLVFSQTITHKDYFEPGPPEAAVEAKGHTPTKSQAWISFASLALSLTVVIGLAKSLSPSIEAGVSAIGAPRATVGIIIALLVLLPETWAAITAARTNQLQTSLNLALGSGAASIALTIPVVGIFAIASGRQLTLGLEAKNMVFLILTFIAGGLTLGGGRSTALAGIVHLVLLFCFLALSFIP